MNKKSDSEKPIQKEQTIKKEQVAQTEQINMKDQMNKKRTQETVVSKSTKLTKKNKKQKKASKIKSQIKISATNGYPETDHRLDYEQRLESRSSSSGSEGSILSVVDADDSEPVIIDIECRTIDNDQFCMRKNKTITFRNIFKKRATKTNKLDYDLRKNDLIGEQYKVVKMMGKGTFSHVFLCRDMNANRDVALKIFTQRNQASLVKIEQTVALHLKRLDQDDKFNFVKMLDTFRCRNQFFIVYESLGPSLYNFMAKLRKKNYTVNEIREVGKQLCATLDFLHAQKIIHTDIKPENILFIDQVNDQNQLTSTRIKLIDFGSSVMNTSNDQKNFGTVTTRHYRAPEVVMKLNEGWSYPIDVFSVGITLFEMHSQKLLFPSVISNLEHFVIMTYTLGELPSMYRKEKPHYFAYLHDLDENTTKKYKSFEKYFNQNDDECMKLAKFIRRMVHYDPAKRATMRELLDDPFLSTTSAQLS